MESASPERQSEPPPGHVANFANFVGVFITIVTLTLPLYAISNFNTAGIAAPQQPSTLFMRAQE
ncbi:MAG: hypothetical protein WA783_19295 [Phormidesmis sp.]